MERKFKCIAKVESLNVEIGEVFTYQGITTFFNNAWMPDEQGAILLNKDKEIIIGIHTLIEHFREITGEE